MTNEPRRMQPNRKAIGTVHEREHDETTLCTLGANPCLPVLSDLDKKLLEAAVDFQRNAQVIYDPPGGKFLLDDLKREARKIQEVNDRTSALVMQMVDETMRQVEAMTLDRIMELLVNHGYVHQVEVRDGFFRVNLNHERNGVKYALYERRIG